MNKKNIALMLILGFALNSFEPCYSMSYMRDSYYSISNRMHNFITKCREVGVLATLYTLVGIYDFKRITGLDENKLDEYSPEKLEEALYRIEVMAKPSTYGRINEIPREKLSQKLDNFYTKISLRLENMLYNTQLKAEEIEMKRISAEHNAKRYAENFADRVENKASDLATRTKEKAQEISSAVKTKAQDVKERVHDAAVNTKTKASDDINQAEVEKEYAKKLAKGNGIVTYDAASEIGTHAKNTIKEAGNALKEKGKEVTAKTKKVVANAVEYITEE